MDAQRSPHIDPVRQVVDGSLVIDSVKEFWRLLEKFPDNPALHKAFSDLLVRKRSVQAGAKFYEKSAGLYIKAGLLAPAILCRLLQWQIQEPTVSEHQLFYDELKMAEFPRSAAARLFRGLSANEFFYLMALMKRVPLAAGEAVSKIGDEEKTLFIICQGSVKRTSIEPLVRNETEHRTASHYLAEDAFFGDIYPFDEPKRCNHYAQAVRPSELLQIDKRQLQMVSKKNPRIELGLIDLYRLRSSKEGREDFRRVRRTARHKVSLPIRLGIRSPVPGGPALSLWGHSRDVSVGGMGAVVDPPDARTAMQLQDILYNKVSLAFPGGLMAVSVMGTIVWIQPTVVKGRKTFSLGVKFDEMPPQFSGFLMAYASMAAETNFEQP